MSSLIFVRRTDGVAHEFTRVEDTDGTRLFRRVDLDLWCRRLPGYGWVVCTAEREVVARPFAEPGDGDVPPAGMWVSVKGDRSYVYDLHRHDQD